MFDFSHKTPKRLPMVSHTIYYHNLISVLVVAAFISRYGNVKASKFSAYKLLKVWTIQFLTVLISNSRINYWGTGHTWSMEQAYIIFSGTKFSGLIWWFKNQIHFANCNLHEDFFFFFLTIMLCHHCGNISPWWLIEMLLKTPGWRGRITLSRWFARSL